KATGYGDDFAGVRDASDKVQKEALCTRVDQLAHAQIAVVTIHSLDIQNLPTFATGLFNNWGIGEKNTNRGVMILLVVKDRRYRIEVGRGLQSVLTNDKVAELGRQVVPMLKDENYSAALHSLTDQISLTIANAAGVSLATSSSQ